VVCIECGKKMNGRVSAPGRPFKYTSCGLPNVLLYGISVYRCPACGDVPPVIPRMGELLRVIAESVSMKKSRLGGEEIRFLRKNIGVSATEFAAAAGIAPATLSRAENNKGSIPIAAEQLLRLMAREAARGEPAREQIKQLAALALAEAGARYAAGLHPEPRRFILVRRKRWAPAA
jgi:putative zinc finger/helix-turn-helix YgiT family protein